MACFNDNFPILFSSLIWLNLALNSWSSSFKFIVSLKQYIVLSLGIYPSHGTIPFCLKLPVFCVSYSN